MKAWLRKVREQMNKLEKAKSSNVGKKKVKPPKPKLTPEERLAWWQHYEQERELACMQRKPEE